MNAVVPLPERRRGLGASDAPAVLGLSPWRSPLEVFLEKTGRAGPQDETLPMRVGKALEPVVLHAFTEHTGLAVEQQQVRFVDPDRPWRWATVDGVAKGALVEAKTSNSLDGWGDEGTDQIPRHYIVQVQHALACTRLAVAYVPVLFFAREFRVYRVERSDELVAAITERETEFWSRVERDDPPPLTTPEDVRLRWPTDSGRVEVASLDAEVAVARLRDLREEMKAREAEKDALTAEVQALMQDAATLVAPDGTALATWKAAKPASRLNARALQAAHPEIYQQFLEPGTASRRFLVK